MSKWILVTGGAGFIGVNLCKKLLSQGKKVLCIDNFCTSNRANLHQFYGNPNFKHIEADICKLGEINLDQYELECIYNLACPASPPLYQALSLETMDVNSIGIVNLLTLAQRRGIKILQSSTSEVYGEPLITPQPESYRGNVNCFGPRSCYDEGKRFAESLCFEFKRVRGVDVRLVRIFNTYGPWLNPTDGRVVSNFVIQAKSGIPITLYGDGEQKRSFCYVDDTVAGLMALMDADSADIDPEFPVYNIGNPIEITVNELATRVIRLTGSKSALEFKPLPQDDPTQRCPDINKAKRDLGWEPRISLEDGLIKTIEHYTELMLCENYLDPIRLYTTLYNGRRVIAPPSKPVEVQIREPLRVRCK